MIAAVVLAAGKSARMGKPKQTLLVEGEPMLQRVLRTLRESKVDSVVVVLGAGAGEIRGQMSFEGEKVVVNRSYDLGMGESLKRGLGAVGRNAEAALVVLADQPFVSSATIDRLVDAYHGSKAPVVAPVYHGLRGNPVLFDRRLFPRIMDVRGDVGAKSVVEEHRDEMLEVEVDDRGVVVDLDTPSDYSKATAQRKARRW